MGEPVVRAPVEGGVEPDVGKVLNETIAEFTDDIGPYVLASLGHTLVVVPVVLIAVLVMYFGMFFVIFGGSFGAAAVAILMTELMGEAVGGLSMLASQLLLFAGIFGVIGAFGAGIAAITAPLNASLVRAVAAHQRGEATLDIASAFGTATKDLVKVVGMAIIMGLLAMFLLMMCYVPVLVLPLVFGFASSMVHLHRKGPISAFTTSVAHFQKHPSFHLVFGALSIALSMVASYVPVLGPAFITALHVRAYREMFGDGEELVF